MKLEDKLCSRRLTRELSMENSTFEIYYGNAPVGVPFMWESQPGTPKAKYRESSLPPLTPPPSFQCNHVNKKNTVKKHSKSNLLQSVFFLPKLNLKKSARLQSSPTSSSSSPSSSSSSSPRRTSYSVPTSPYTPSSLRQVGLSSPRLSFDSRAGVRNHEDDYEVSIPCFRAARGANPRNRAGCSANMIKLLFGEVHVMN